MKTTPMHAVLATVLCGALGAHAADEPRFYLSADVGRSDFRLHDDELGALLPMPILGLAAVIQSKDSKDRAYALHAGYRLNANWALEAGYADLGDASFVGSRVVNCRPGDICSQVVFPAYRGSLSAKAWDASVVGSYALAASWSAYGKLGVSLTRIKTTVAGSLPATTLSSSHRSTVPLLAAGVAYQLTPAASVHLEWNRHFDGSGDSRNGKADIDAYTLGVGYRF